MSETVADAPAPEDPAPPPHRHLRYGGIRISFGEQIGRGGYSTVYRATDSWQNRLVVKVYNAKGSHAMWTNEVRNYQALPHPGIVHMHGAFELDGVFYLILADGGMALGRIALDDPAERRLVVQLAAGGMLEALHFMHDEGFVHTDINPYNALLELGPQNVPLRVRLCDLGLTRKRDEMRPDKHKAKWNPSPETVDRDRFGPEGPAMDIYSTAQVLLQVLLPDELPRYTDEEISAGAPRQLARSLGEPLGDALAVGLEPESARRVSAYELWKRIRSAVGR